MLKIRYYGHACFEITSGSKILLTDPFNGEMGYRLRPLKANIVTSSHAHGDHAYFEKIEPGYMLCNTENKTERDGFSAYGVKTFHDGVEGKLRGKNLVYVIQAEGIRVVHCGDLGHLLSDEQIEAIGRCDVLMVPVGGYYTIDAGQAAEVAAALKPTVIIPMHYATDATANWPIAGADAFLDIMRRHNYSICESSDSAIELDAADMPHKDRVVCLEYKR